MKKTLSLILALTLALSMGITAFATDMTVNGDKNHNVSANYVAGTDGGTTYGVDITWGNMTFTYTDSSKGTWNADDHVYENGTEAKWTCAEDADKITVVNHSNASIVVTPAYTAETDYASATVSFDKATLTLPSADSGEGAAQTGTITVTVSGTLTKDDKTTAAGGTTIGQITLTLVDAATVEDAAE